MPYKRIDEGVPEDTEGNMPLRKNVEQGEPETDDAEGNRIKLIKGPAIDADMPETDDTEGNRIKLIRGQG